MRGRALTAAAIILLALPAGAAAETTTITIPGKYFDPPRSTVVAGDVLLFRNTDLVTHDVRIAGGAFDSGPLPRFTAWSQQLDQPGSYPFVCTLHPFMSGAVEVVASTLSAAPDGVLVGEPLTLSGRTRPGSMHVDVEQSVSGGDWSRVGDGAMPAPDGTFKVAVPAVEGAAYRVSTPAGPGQVVTPRVTAHVDVHLALRRTRRHRIVRVHVTPAVPGLTATLQLYSRWRFAWRSERRAELDAHGRASFRLPAARRAYARVVVSRGARGPALVHSGTVKLWNGRTAQDPDTIAPPGGGGHH